MARPDKNEEREERIHHEAIVDAYGPEEHAISWYCYLDDKLHFPFAARCVTRRATSPLKPGDKVEVVGMAPVAECDHDMFVMIQQKRDHLAVPLVQLEGVKVDEDTQQAIEDWRYWVERGYEF